MSLDSSFVSFFLFRYRSFKNFSQSATLLKSMLLVINLSLISNVKAAQKQVVDCNLLSRHQSALAEKKSGFGPLKIQMQQEKFEQVRKNNGTFYTSAKEFSSTLGRQLVKLVQSRLLAQGKSTIVIAMGGAEHIGTLLELFIEKANLHEQVDILYVPLSKAIMRPWYAQNAQLKERSGIGAVPEGYRVHEGRASDPESFIAFLKSYNIFRSAKTLVLDTGFLGTSVEAVAFAGAKLGYQGVVEGVLLSHAANRVLNSVPIYSVNHSLKLDTNLTARWAAILDENNMEGTEYTTVFDAFPRSYETIARYQDDHLQIESIRSLNLTEDRENYEATLIGLWDGLYGP